MGTGSKSQEQRCSRSSVPAPDDDGARVGLEEIYPEHVCAVKQGSDNVFAFHTTRYCDSPLVVRGPGAGLDVTAAGVFADVLEALAISREQ